MNNKDKLTEYRNQIDEIDIKMAELFCSRMNVSEKIGEYKRERSLPVFDEKRESALLKKNIARLPDEKLNSYYIRFIKNIIELSRERQQVILDGIKVAYTGVDGAFAQIAAKRIFKDARLISFGDFRQAYASVAEGKCECCVLPIENSTVGDVGQVIDLMYEGNLHVNGIYNLPIRQNLLGIEGATPDTVKTVISHPQALGQAADYLKNHGYSCVQESNTALAAKRVAESGDKTIAAVASIETAGIYGLKVLANDINGQNENATRFAVLSAKESSEGSSVSIIFFNVSNEAGALAKAINIIGQYGYNMKSLRSRPKNDSAWQYYFYVEVEGNVYTEHGRLMLSQLTSCCDTVKVVGSFSEYDL